MSSSNSEEGLNTSQVVGFGLLLLCTVTSPYISRLMFTVFDGLQNAGAPLFLLRETKRLLLYPVTLLLALMFIYFAIFVLLPQVSNGSKPIVQVLFSVYLFFLWVAFMLFIYRSFLLAISFTTFVMQQKRVTQSTRYIVFEIIWIVVALSFVAILLSSFGGIVLNSSSTVTSDLLQLIFKLNFLTATGIVAMAPVFRDAVAGLTIHMDDLFKKGDTIEITGVCPIGIVEDLYLRTAKVRLLDKTLLHLPNRFILRRPLVNFSKRSSIVMEMRIPLEKDTPSRVLRLFIQDVETALNADNGKEKESNRTEAHSYHEEENNETALLVDHAVPKSAFQVTVSLDDTVTLVISVGLSERGFVGDHKERTNLMLSTIEIMQNFNLRPRGAATFKFVSMEEIPDSSTLGYYKTLKS
mmetsp:Transcript_17545/g.22963  ORF Transcript_17545/g.22963 Transcript_17545/m.22963 type:complete len:410 (-) Transcript_17545:1052-2281(-)